VERGRLHARQFGRCEIVDIDRFAHDRVRRRERIRFRAFATATGEKLWEVKLPSSIEATPVTYLGSDQRQFVTVVSTGGSLTGSDVTSDEIIAFAVPKK